MRKEMVPLWQVVDQHLEWRQLYPFSSRFELRAGDVVAACLHLPRLRSGHTAEAESRDGKWSFRLAGIFGGVKIRVYGSETEDPRFCQNQKGTWILGGNRYLWLRSGWTTEEGESLVLLKSQLAFLRREWEVLVEPRAARIPELSLLLLLGLYLKIVESLPDAGSQF
jgi:hypothetical protein